MACRCFLPAEKCELLDGTMSSEYNNWTSKRGKYLWRNIFCGKVGYMVMHNRFFDEEKINQGASQQSFDLEASAQAYIAAMEDEQAMADEIVARTDEMVEQAYLEHMNGGVSEEELARRMAEIDEKAERAHDEWLAKQENLL